MSNVFSKAWSSVIKPMLFRPKRVQVAALCYRTTEDQKEVLMVTSRGTGRWILPKGWPIKGKDGGESALQEAWEEAGVQKGQVEGAPIGAFSYEKELKTGLPVPVETFVYSIANVELCDDYPEAHQRKRQWFSPQEAANRVREPELQALLRQL
ncbi:hydrolase, NUDIX family protein [Roseobacter sp. SK209-2-6]|uniref:NUDIX hydrolase n=1 Tax=Roseobacter sp. SK209-2-6 TaxID=388739 RepID=UPI0000F3EEDE|nr:NUDIX hydrolase [Roseobacter sp. SK209-2-6]EBA15484.1 hydrolase, NUDIX family protein [Roseobacter sp. SK209-2-6]